MNAERQGGVPVTRTPIVIADTPQEFFDKTVAHLRRQGKQAYVDGKGCRYRTDDGLCCAFGFHIPDDQYDESMEGVGVYVLVDRGAVRFAHRETEYIAGRMQNIHDGYCQPEWESDFRSLALRENLTYTPCAA